MVSGSAPAVLAVATGMDDGREGQAGGKSDSKTHDVACHTTCIGRTGRVFATMAHRPRQGLPGLPGHQLREPWRASGKTSPYGSGCTCQRLLEEA